MENPQSHYKQVILTQYCNDKEIICDTQGSDTVKQTSLSESPPMRTILPPELGTVGIPP